MNKKVFKAIDNIYTQRYANNNQHVWKTKHISQ